MDKGKNINSEHFTEETLGVSMVSFLLKEGKVVIPELGYLELKVFPDKQTVLFKGTENTALFLASEGSIQSHIYNNVSIPLKEGKVVNIPEVGIFRPMKNSDGSYRISFTISSALRKLLNGVKDDENEAKKPETGEIIIEADEKIEVPIVESIANPVVDQNIEEKSEEKKEEAEVGESKINYKAVERKESEKERGKAPAPKREINAGERKMPSYVRNTSKVGDLVVPQGEKAKNVTNIRSIIVIAAALIFLIFIVWYFLPDRKNKRDHIFVTGNNTESIQTIDQSKGSAESSESIDLPSLAERKYGNRIFWVYIYEANRDKISSPVNIPAGTNLRIPNLWEDYKVDVMDSMEVRRAEILSNRMLKRKLQL